MIENEVHFRVADDLAAQRIFALLEALGYVPVRELDNAEVRVRWAVELLARRYKLTLRETDVLERVLAGQTNAEIGRDLEISRATVKWHSHNMLSKMGVENREGLFRLALHVSAGPCSPATDPGAVETAEPPPTLTAKPWF